MKGGVFATGCLILLGCLVITSCVGISQARDEQPPAPDRASAAAGETGGAPEATSEAHEAPAGRAAAQKAENPLASRTTPEAEQRLAEEGQAAPRSASTPKPMQQRPRDLTQDEISREIIRTAQQGSWPVNENGRVVDVERALSDSGSPDIFALFAGVPTLTDAAVSTLSDFGRLFKADLKPVSFSLKVFLQKDGRLLLRRTVSLGEYYVFESMRTVAIHKGANLPFAVSVTFQTADGSDDQWVIFSELGISRFTLQETLSRSAMVEDIDGDGYLDIIFRERGVEEGTGYETFLTWYKWNGRGFVEYRTTNIVRNLRDFVSRASELLSAGRIDAFLTMAITKDTLMALRRAGLDDSAIFFRIFRSASSADGNPSPPLDDVKTIRKVVFPNIVENPFSQSGQGYFSFPLTARVVSADDESHFFTARIVLSRNPFVAPEFTFAVVPPGATSSTF